MTNGARVMLSTPPAIISSASPARMARAAVPTASRPEPHSRLIVEPETCVRQASQQRRHARDIAVVLAGLVGAAIDHVVELIPVDRRVALLQHAHRMRGQIVGAHILQDAAVAADRRADEVADIGVGHGNPPEVAVSRWPRPSRGAGQGGRAGHDGFGKPMPRRRHAAQETPGCAHIFELASPPC